MKKKIYISGPITGLERQVYIKNFSDKERELRAMGYDVVNPTKLLPSKFLFVYKIIGYKLTILYDLWHLMKCDYIYLLDGWMKSKGAKVERYVARVFGIKRITTSITLVLT